DPKLPGSPHNEGYSLLKYSTHIRYSTTSMKLSEIVIVLSRPAESGNVGAVCRAMKNMGLHSLRIVAPEAPLSDEQIRARAIHAADVWEQAAFYETLSEALADCALVVGTTHRRGKKRKQISLTPEELADFMAERPGPGAIVFGNERTGLESDELELCSLASHIPVDPDFPSLNLSHAVQVYTYILHRRLTSVVDQTVQGTWIPMPHQDLAILAKSMADSLASIGFYKQAGRREQERFFTDLLARAAITKEEGQYLNSIFNKIGHLRAH
ncbi:MAG: RNA methyltransferase, partial [Termitinemataceae bacterium]